MKLENLLGLVVTGALLLSTPVRAQSGAVVTIQADQPGPVVSSNLFGIFFEEINYGGEGGIYAEMVRNRAFYSASSPLFWTLVTQGSASGSITVDPGRSLSTNIPNSLNLTLTAGTGSIGAGNSGFWGMSLVAGATYDLNFYACATNGFAGPVGARLESADGSTVYAQTSFSGLTANWQHYAAPLVSSGTDTNARLVVSIANPGTIWLDVVSLFPRATFHSRTNGLKLNLANALAALKPSFFRFPGGNYIESNTTTNAVRWKKSIGDIAARPGHLNDSWGYWSSDGFGAYEFFQYCEDMGMQPLYGINAGLMLGYNGSTNNTVPLDQMGPWVQDALDLIQYANGDTNTTWGAVRAASGHPAPFNLKYLEIGNENGGSYYDARYTLFYDAIKAQYPDIKLISPVWGSPSSPVSRPVEIMDEHYYASPATFISYATKYDSYSRSGPKVFVGEYAVTSGYGTYGNLSAALGEAAFMTGMERNSDVVQMASYAPLFANVNGIQWHPDLIYYDSSRWFGTPSYYVQMLFGQNRGDVVLPSNVAVTGNTTNAALHGAIGVGSWNTAVQYTNIMVTSNGVTLYQSDFAGQGTNGWHIVNGTWSANAGLFQQTSTSTTDCRASTGNTNWANYTLSLRARKTAGSEGFTILFNWMDDNNWTWLNVGGWGNTLTGIEQNSGGAKTILGTRISQVINANTWYDISITLTGNRMQCYVNGSLVQDVTYPSGLIASTTYARTGGQIIVKAVNPYSTPLTTTFNIAGVNAVAANASVIQLTSGSAADENSLAAPTYVSPVTNTIANAGTNFTLTLPANSLSILRLQAVGVNFVTNLLFSVPSPINSGQAVASALWGQKTGTAGLVSLTTNSSYVISYSSDNPAIASVDTGGNVVGIAGGTANIIASYASLGISATQTVKVVSVPVSLVHRYSFNETAGTNCADSVGGAPWNGTLPNGGTFGGGQLALSAAGSQYVQLPAGILTNYTALTIEAWLTYPNQIPNNAFLFGFGNTIGGAGYDYIFCAPQAGRVAISGGTYSSEQNAYGNFDFSFHTNLHFTAVFNPPLGCVTFYTNAVLAGYNYSVTTPMSLVNDVFSYIGKSLYTVDPYADLVLDEFRIYNGALNTNQIAATHALGANTLLNVSNPVVGLALKGNALTLAWPLASAGFTVQTRTNLVLGTWSLTNLIPQMTNGQWQVVIPVTGNAQYYRLQQ
ncbi:MAG: alpha-L-arabinofuranosidase C-terminal domain-containing protein [Verrucomicrobiae bacterium]|nr:alpha-L-arabinofuranosidase C-terminal domain-containing protein [Verrucomicrobiae bacterium]